MAKKLVTPEMAEKWLEKNEHNRKITPSNVNKIAKMMKENKWAYNGEGVIIGSNGTLLDGQHRLLAVVKAKKDVWMEVVENVEEICEYTGVEVFATIDTGRNRSASDMISIQTKGINALVATKIMQVIKAIDTKTLKKSTSNGTNVEVLSSFLENQELIEMYSEDCAADEKTNAYPYMKAAEFAVARYALRNEDVTKREAFIHMLVNFEPEMLKDSDECSGENENLCRLISSFYLKMSDIYETSGSGTTFTSLKHIGILKAYHYFRDDIKTGMGISKNMDIIYPKSLDK